MDEQSDEMMSAITEAVELGRAGQADAARQRLASVWARIGPAGDPFHRCVLAHYLADLQDDPTEELAWDLRALEALDGLTDERVQRRHDTLTVEGFVPSLHLNLAEDYRRLGRYELARTHLHLARESAPVLADDAYGATIRSGMDRVAQALAQRPETGEAPP